MSAHLATESHDADACPDCRLAAQRLARSARVAGRSVADHSIEVAGLHLARRDREAALHVLILATVRAA